MNRIVIFLTLVLMISCSRDKKILTEDEKLFIGYWVPKKINWLKPDSGDKQIDSLVRYADFTTLCFSENQFDLINSTNSYSLGYDSLVFEFEPGIMLFRGKWEVKDSLILIEHRLKFSAQYPTGKNSESVRDTLVITPDKSELIFNGEHFIKTVIYAKASADKIEAYRASDRY